MVLEVPAKLSVGSVLKEGDTLMTLAPMNAPVEAEIEIASRDVGFIRPGDPVTIKIDAFDFAAHGTVEGVVKSIAKTPSLPTTMPRRRPPITACAWRSRRSS